jgi:predicted CXXCH cytochrome family protein
MKKLLFAVVFGLLLIAAISTIALADNGPHGSFTASTDACASCHRAHSAQYGGNALLIMAPDLLCLSCHDGSGAGTNVEDGVYSQAGADTYYPGAGVTVEGLDAASLLGGGFTNALMATTWSGAATANSAFDAVSATTTSVHTHDGTSGTVWGSGAANSANGTYSMECVSCHDPHGTAGWNVSALADGDDTRVATYRLLRWQPSGSNGFTSPGSVNWSGGAFPISDMGTAAGTDVPGWTVPDNFPTIGTEWYTIGDETDISRCGQPTTNPCGTPFAVGDYSAGTTNIVYLPDDSAGAAKNYIPAAVNVAYFCAQCHDRYFANSSLRNNTDASAYCGEPGSASAVLPDYPDADGLAPWIHPNDSTRCQPVLNAAGTLLVSWGDNAASGDTIYAFMHSSGDSLRIAADGTGTVAGTATQAVKRSCVACHVAHGTSAQMTTFAGTADPLPNPPMGGGGSLAGGSTLLRMDNRSICLRCHAGTVNYTVGP